MPTKPTRRRRDAEPEAPAHADLTNEVGRPDGRPPLEPDAVDSPADSHPHRRGRARADRERARVIDAP
jgi:hypothetical protein